MVLPDGFESTTHPRSATKHLGYSPTNTMSQNNDQTNDSDTFEQSGPIAAWAGSHGLDAHAGLVLTGCVLAHVGGESVMFQDSNGFNGMPPPSFVGVESDVALRSALASLTGPIATTQHALLLKSRQHDNADLEEALAECNRRSHRVLDDLQDRENKFGGSWASVSDHGIAGDTQVERRTVRYESLARPRFQMDGSPPADPAQALSSYHFARAFLAGGVEQLPGDNRRRHQRLDQLARFVRGEEITVKTGSHHERVTASLRGGMFFPDQQFEWLMDERRDFLGLFVPVASDASAKLPIRVDSLSVDKFYTIFTNEMRLLIASRRAFAGAHARIIDPGWLAHYLEMRRDFIRECSAFPAELRTPSIICLPDLVAWTLIRLGRGELPDDYICTRAFATARHVREKARWIYMSRDNARDAAQRKLLAERLIRRLLRLGPCKRRKLVRGSDDMRLIVHEPVIAVLVKIGVFVETEDKTLTIGRVPTNSLPPTLFIEIPQPHES